MALKLHNFASIDPDHHGRGMSHGSAADRLAWDTWAHRPDELSAFVAAVRRAADQPANESDSGEEEEHEAEEGRLLYRPHRRYERDRNLAARKKQDTLKRTGTLACEVCGFDSAKEYGPDVAGVVDVHHITPLHKIGQSRTRLSNLACGSSIPGEAVVVSIGYMRSLPGATSPRIRRTTPRSRVRELRREWHPSIRLGSGGHSRSRMRTG